MNEIFLYDPLRLQEIDQSSERLLPTKLQKGDVRDKIAKTMTPLVNLGASTKYMIS
ncbi:MAG TPA: hypothetical protein VIT91_09755 [Chthoniobacterales bacterium]